MNTRNNSRAVVDNSGIFAVSQGFYDVFNNINIVLLPTIAVVGICGNIVGVLLITRDSGRGKLVIFHYLISMFIVHGLYLLNHLFFQVLVLVEYLDFNTGNYIYAICSPYRGYIDLSLNHISSALLIVMSVERMMYVLIPYRVTKSFFTKFPRLIIAAVVIVSFTYLIPFALTFRAVQIQSPDNTTRFAIGMNLKYAKVFSVVNVIEVAVLNYIFPLVVLFVNVLTIVSLSRYVKQGHRSAVSRTSAVSSKQKTITAVIVTVAILHVILSVPNMFVQTLMTIDKDYRYDGPYSLTFDFFIEFGDLLASINAAVTIFIYVLLPRKQCYLVCSCCQISSESDISSSNTKSTTDPLAHISGNSEHSK